MEDDLYSRGWNDHKEFLRQREILHASWTGTGPLLALVSIMLNILCVISGTVSWLFIPTALLVLSLFITKQNYQQYFKAHSEFKDKWKNTVNKAGDIWID